MSIQENLEDMKQNLLYGMETYILPFPEQDRPYTQGGVYECENILDEYIFEVLGFNGDEDKIMNQIKITIEKLNDLNSNCNYELIESEQSEELCEIIVETAENAGCILPKEDITFRWREW